MLNRSKGPAVWDRDAKATATHTPGGCRMRWRQSPG
jgi:hypothetical protein